MNGHIVSMGPTGFSVLVEHSFGNCPQYIHARTAVAAEADESHIERQQSTETRERLDEVDRHLIESADTFFVASYVSTAENGHGGASRRAQRQVDVSHRGGNPGFVHVNAASRVDLTSRDTLTIPDFKGNRLFNTLGNFLTNPVAGLVFVDFNNGDLLHLTGETTLVLEGLEIAKFLGAKRLWKFHVAQIIRRRGALRTTFGAGKPSPRSLATGTWLQSPTPKG